ncbi:hypothetical protein ACIBG8_14680 [Nonomuraea sp. NPDC050556]|uniref:hypothetical protein n=1 Tax=Nonomuraea sp. NPDC050556 TaxID=3364369 RepID=UPI00378B6D6F
MLSKLPRALAAVLTPSQRWGLRTRSIIVLATLPLVFLPGAAPVAADVDRTASVSFTPESWTYVSSLQQNKSFLNDVGPAPLGTGDSASDVRRSFFQLNLTAIQAAPSIKSIDSAQLVFTRNTPCGRDNSEGFKVWTTGQINRHTDWRHQPEWLRQIGVSQITCGVDGRYTVNVTGTIRTFLAGSENLLTLGLASRDEVASFGNLLLNHDPELKIAYTYTTTGSQQPAPQVESFTPTGWTYADSGDRQASHWNEDVAAPVGRDGNRAQRSFFTFQPAALEGRRLARATLKLDRVKDCQVGEHALEVWSTGAISARTTWNAQPTWNAKVSTHTWDACRSTLELDVSAAVLGDGSPVTLGLRATDEKDTLSRYVFANAPQLIVESSVPPAMPENTAINEQPCEGRPYLGTATPQAYATVEHSFSEPVNVRFEWENLDGTRLGESVVELDRGWPYARASSPAGIHDGSYRWRARSEDSWTTSNWSPWCEYRLDLVAPETAPTVTSTLYKDSTPAGGIDVPGEFKLSVNGATDVKGFRVSLGGVNDLPVGEDGTATVTFTPAASGVHTMEAYTYDKAGNRSPVTTYTFTVAKSAPDVPTALRLTQSGYSYPPVTRPDCATGDERPFFIAARSSTHEANFSHREGGFLNARFQWQTLDGEAVDEQTAPAYSGNTTLIQMTDKVHNGGVYRWRVRAEDRDQPGLVSEWSRWCEFGIDSTPPDKVASVTVSGRQVTFGPNGMTDIAGYVFYRSLGDGQPIEGVQVTVTIPESGYGEVRPFDRAGNLGPVTSFTAG